MLIQCLSWLRYFIALRKYKCALIILFELYYRVDNYVLLNQLQISKAGAYIRETQLIIYLGFFKIILKWNKITIKQLRQVGKQCVLMRGKE